MARPIVIPNVFQNQTGNIPLSQLDTDFSTIATAVNDPASYANYAVDSGAVNAYIITLNPSPSSLVSMVGVTITFKPLVTNTGASTINVNGFGAINIVNTDSSALFAGEIVAGNIFQLSYNGTNFILMSVTTNLVNLANATGVLIESHGGTGTTTGYYGFKNRIINGSFQIWQRGTSGFTATGYCTDRMIMGIAGTISVAKSSNPTSQNGNFYLSATTGAASSVCNLLQCLERDNVYALRGKTVCFSGWVQVGGVAFTGTLTPVINYSNTTDASASVGTLVTQLTTVTVTPNASWQQVKCTFVVPTDAVGLSCAINHGALQASGVITSFSDFQLELGSTATSFDYRPYGTELALCQRYFQSMPSKVRMYGYNTTSGESIVPMNFPVYMRTAPTMTSNFEAASGAVGSLENISTQGFSIQMLATVGGVFRITYSSNNTASSEL